MHVIVAPFCSIIVQGIWGKCVSASGKGATIIFPAERVGGLRDPMFFLHLTCKGFKKVAQDLTPLGPRVDVSAQITYSYT